MRLYTLYKHKCGQDIAIEPLEIQIDYDISRFVVSVQYWNIAHRRKFPLNLFETHMLEYHQVKDWIELDVQRE